MANAADDVEGVVTVGILLGIVLLFVWGLSKLGLFSGASSGAGISSGSSSTPTVNGVTGIAAGLQKGIAGLIGATPDQVFGANATGFGSSGWWNNFWSWLLPWARPLSSDSSLTIDPTSAMAFDQSGAMGAFDPTLVAQSDPHNDPYGIFTPF